MSRLRHYAVLAVSALGLVGLVVTYPGGVGAAPQSASFSTPGSSDWIVPDGVTSVTVDAYGAAGGNGQIPEEPSEGGLGGRTRATIEVTPGETLQVNVGGLGGSYTGGGPAIGGTNGGGDAGGYGAGGGGGASGVGRGGTSVDDRVVVAGGGGGGGARQNVCEIADGGDGGGDAECRGSTNDATGGEPAARMPAAQVVLPDRWAATARAVRRAWVARVARRWSPTPRAAEAAAGSAAAVGADR
jgi:hypothetical protein